MKWDRVPLGELCAIKSGGTPSRSKLHYFGGCIPWVKITDLLQGEVLQTEECLSDAGIENSAARVLPKGTVLISIFATIGRTAVLGIDAATNQAVAGITPNDPERLRPRYLRYFLDASRPTLERLARGVAQPNINQAVLKALEVPVPPSVEQDQIVDLLSRAENIVRMRREAEQKAKEIIPALFLDMFGDPGTNPRGWEVRHVGDVIRSAEYGTSTKASEDGSGMPVIRMGNVDVTGRLSLADLKYVVLPEAAQRKYALETGDILFNRTNSKELVGKTGIWRLSEPAVAASYFVRVRVNEDTILPDYFWAFMNTRHMKSVLYSTARGAIGQSNINAQELRALAIPCPPTSLQQAFAGRTAEALDLEQQQRRASETGQTAFQSLLAGVFSVGCAT